MLKFSQHFIVSACIFSLTQGSIVAYCCKTNGYAEAISLFNPIYLYRQRNDAFGHTIVHHGPFVFIGRVSMASGAVFSGFVAVLRRITHHDVPQIPPPIWNAEGQVPAVVGDVLLWSNATSTGFVLHDVLRYPDTDLCSTATCRTFSIAVSIAWPFVYAASREQGFGQFRAKGSLSNPAGIVFEPMAAVIMPDIVLRGCNADIEGFKGVLLLSACLLSAKEGFMPGAVDVYGTGVGQLGDPGAVLWAEVWEALFPDLASHDTVAAAHHDGLVMELSRLASHMGSVAAPSVLMSLSNGTAGGLWQLRQVLSAIDTAGACRGLGMSLAMSASGVAFVGAEAVASPLTSCIFAFAHIGGRWQQVQRWLIRSVGGGSTGFNAFASIADFPSVASAYIPPPRPPHVEQSVQQEEEQGGWEEEGITSVMPLTTALGLPLLVVEANAIPSSAVLTSLAMYHRFPQPWLLLPGLCGANSSRIVLVGATAETQLRHAGEARTALLQATNASFPPPEPLLHMLCHSSGPWNSSTVHAPPTPIEVPDFNLHGAAFNQKSLHGSDISRIADPPVHVSRAATASDANPGTQRRPMFTLRYALNVACRYRDDAQAWSVFEANAALTLCSKGWCGFRPMETPHPCILL